MTAIIDALLGGVLGGVVAMLAGIRAELAFGLGALATVVIFAAAGAAAGWYFVRDQATLEGPLPLGPGRSRAGWFTRARKQSWTGISLRLCKRRRQFGDQPGSSRRQRYADAKPLL